MISSASTSRRRLTETREEAARSNIYAAPFDALAYNGMQINGSMEVSQELRHDGHHGQRQATSVMVGRFISAGTSGA